MGLPNCSFDSTLPLILDASVVINLNATGVAAYIFDAIANPISIVDVVTRELEGGRVKGRTDGDLISFLFNSGRAQSVSLTAECEENFLTMVSGSGASTLDDGEAATIAWAVAHGGVAVIDEKKGTAFCNARFPSVPVITTIDLFRHESVLANLGPNISDAVYNALTIARMRVQDRDIQWVIDTIGTNRVANCHSLPLSVRRAHLKVETMIDR